MKAPAPALTLPVCRGLRLHAHCERCVTPMRPAQVLEKATAPAALAFKGTFTTAAQVEAGSSALLARRARAAEERAAVRARAEKIARAKRRAAAAKAAARRVAKAELAAALAAKEAEEDAQLVANGAHGRQCMRTPMRTPAVALDCTSADSVVAPAAGLAPARRACS